MYSKKMRFAGVEFGTIELTQEVPGVSKTFMVLNLYLNPDVDRNLVLEIVREVFDLSDLQEFVFKSLNGAEFIQLSYTIQTMVRRMSNYLHAKARQIARNLFRRLKEQKPFIFNRLIEHSASEFHGYIPGKASWKAYQNGQIDHTGRFIR